MTLQTKENLESLNKQEIEISSMKESYNERLEKIIINNIKNNTATNIDTDAKFDKKLEKQLHPLTLQANDNLRKKKNKTLKYLQSKHPMIND